MAVDRYSERGRTLAHLAEMRPAGDASASLNRSLRVVVGSDALATRAGQLLVITAINLAARLCDQIVISTDGAVVEGGARVLLAADRLDGTSLVNMADRIWKGTFTVGATTAPDVTIGIGNVAGPIDLGLGVDFGGAAVVRRNEAVSIARRDAPIAALVSAAIGVSQAAKLLYPRILGGRVDDLVRMDRGPFGGELDAGHSIVPARPVLVGVGAVGSACIYALVAADATGDIVVVDPDRVKDRDLMRYVLFDDRHIESDKVEAAAKLAEGTGIRLDPHPTVLSKYLSDDPARRRSIELVLSLVDSYEQRSSIAGELPRWILNAGTADRDLTVSQHGLGDGWACLRCLYPPQARDVTREAVIARELHLSLADVHERLMSKAPMSRDDVRAIAAAQGKKSTAYDGFIGDPLDTFYRMTCGTTATALDRTGEGYAPITFLPALAGFLVASALLNSSVQERHFRVDVLDGLASPRRRSMPVRADCDLCGRPTIVTAYRQKWKIST